MQEGLQKTELTKETLKLDLDNAKVSVENLRSKINLEQIEADLMADLLKKSEKLIDKISVIENQINLLPESNDEESQITELEDIKKIIVNITKKSEDFIKKYFVSFLEDQEISLMLENDFESIEDLKGGIHGGAKFVKIKNDGNAVYKTYEQHQILDKKNFIGAEKAVYLLSRALNFNFVPPTVIKHLKNEKGKYVYGSVQEFIPNSKCLSELSDEEINQIPDDEKFKIAIFDFIISNTDRNGGNVLVKDGKLIAIDHGMAMDYFKKSQGLPTGMFHDATMNWIADLYKKPMPDKVINFFKDFNDNDSSIKKLEQEITDLLGDKIAYGYINRVKAFSESLNENNIFDLNKFNKNLDKYNYAI